MCAARRVGLVVSERMINTPPEVSVRTHSRTHPIVTASVQLTCVEHQLSPPLVDGLFEEIADIGGDWWWKTEKAPTQALQQAYDFQQLLILTRVYRDDEDDSVADPPRAGPSQTKRAKLGPQAPAAALAGTAGQKLIYPKPEDEAFHAHAAWAFTFPAAVSEPSAVADKANKVTQMRLVMCVPASAAPAVRAHTRQLVATSGQTAQ